MKLDRLAAALASVGLMLIVGSFAWPHLNQRGPGAWTEEKALRHAQTRAELHAASHALMHGDQNSEGRRAQELQARFEAELAELDAVRRRGETGARILWGTGIALVVAGAAFYFLRRTP